MLLNKPEKSGVLPLNDLDKPLALLAVTLFNLSKLCKLPDAFFVALSLLANALFKLSTDLADLSVALELSSPILDQSDSSFEPTATPA